MASKSESRSSKETSALKTDHFYYQVQPCYAYLVLDSEDQGQFRRSVKKEEPSGGKHLMILSLCRPEGWVKSLERTLVTITIGYSGAHLRSDAYSNLLSKPQLLSMT